MSARDDILCDLRDARDARKRRGHQNVDLHAAGPAPSPAVDAAHTEGLIDRFVERLQSVGGETLRVESTLDLPAALKGLLQRWAVNGVVLLPDPLVAELNLAALLKEAGQPVAHLEGLAQEKAWRQELVDAAAQNREPGVPWDLSIGGCVGAIAETGSVAHQTTLGKGRAPWALCRAQLVILNAEQIVPDLEDLFVECGALDRSDLPRAVTLITGPSRTADIEQTLTIGVHGPARFAALVIG